MTLIQRVVEYAAERHIPKKKVAAVCGIHPSVLSNWITGEVDTIPSKCIPPLARLFNVSCDELLTGEKNLTLSDDQRRVLNMFNELDRDGQLIVLATIVNERRRIDKTAINSDT